MGVVYRARHAALGRLVALKMILGGAWASPVERQRFRIEAEFAAQLDHPYIVPIYDVGEHEGQPYFTMKLIDGTTLSDQLNDWKSDRRAAAGLVAKLARPAERHLATLGEVGPASSRGRYPGCSHLGGSAHHLRRNGLERVSLTGHKHSIFSLAFSRDGKTLASGDTGGTIRLWRSAVKVEPHTGRK